MKFLTPVIIQLCSCALSIELPLQFLPCLLTVSTEIYPSSPCRRLHLQGCSFSHYIFFSLVTYPSICGNPTPSCAPLWSPLTPSCLDSLHDCLFRYKQYRGKILTRKFRDLGSVPWWQYYLVMPSSKHSCHCCGWEAGEGLCIVAALVTA